MAKLLISWIDDRYDFDPPKSINVSKKGINYQIHRYHFKEEKYDKHIIFFFQEKHLSSVEAFINTIGKDFGKRNIESEQLLIKDPINLEEVQAQTQNALMKYDGHQLDIFINPGYQMMQLSFFICHTTLNLKTRLLQVRRAQYTDSGKPLLEVIKIQPSKEGYALMAQQHALHEQKPITEIFEAEGLKDVYYRAKKVAQVPDIPVLINGESGTGKEGLAAYIYKNTPSKGPYYKVNCAAFSDELLLSELFGHAKGAFTGAINEKEGYFEKAKDGMLFLDEIGDISKFAQVALLRVLQEGVIQKVGDTEPKKVNVRVIAATNRNLVKKVKEGSFRQDLYYRLAKTRLILPSWEEYSQKDKKGFIDYMLKKVSIETRRKSVLKLDKKAYVFLSKFSMPGNIRQLENIIKGQYVFYHDQDAISRDHLERELEEELHYLDEMSDSLKLEDVEKAHIRKVLRKCKYNKTKACELLGIKSVNTLKKKIEIYGINVPE